MAKPFSMDVEALAFGQVLNAMAEDVADERMPTFLRKTMFEIMSRVIKRTPVDTGRARAGWSAASDIKGQPSVGTFGGSAGAVAEGESRSTLTDELDGSSGFIEVTNAVKYILSLEFGRSDQAPQGMVRVTLREMATGADVGQELLDVIENIFESASIRSSARGRSLPG